VHFTSCFSTYNCSSQLREKSKNFIKIAYLTNWNDSIFGYKLRTDLEQLWLKILKKLRTASLNSEFTGSYKKSVIAEN